MVLPRRESQASRDGHHAMPSRYAGAMAIPVRALDDIIQPARAQQILMVPVRRRCSPDAMAL
jgi:hypothetical protein